MRAPTWLALAALLVGTCSEPALADEVCIPRETAVEALACLEAEDADCGEQESILRIDLDACRAHREVDGTECAARIAAVETERDAIAEAARAVTEPEPAMTERPEFWLVLGGAVVVAALAGYGAAQLSK